MEILISILILAGALGVILSIGYPIYKKWVYLLHRTDGLKLTHRRLIIKAFWASAVVLLIGVILAVFTTV